MKKFFILSMLALVLFAACDPMEDIYARLDDSLATPYKEYVNYTLATADYSTISKTAYDALDKTAATWKTDSVNAKAIGSFASFGATRIINNYTSAINALLIRKYPALNLGSAVYLKYDYANTSKILTESKTLPLTDQEYYVLTAADYTAIGTPVSADGGFTGITSLTSSSNKLAPYIKSTINPGVSAGKILVINLKFRDNSALAFENRDVYFTYDGSKWIVDINTGYALTIADYDAMGILSGMPGNNDNFSSSVTIATFMPFWLKNNSPYKVISAAGTSRNIIYKYYNGSAVETRLQQYTYNGAAWIDKTQKSEQYVHNGTDWMLDPTITFKMVKDDYKIIVEYVKTKPEIANYVLNENPLYGEKDWYYGSDPSYPEFQMRLSTRRLAKYDPNGTLTNKTDAEAMVILNDRMKEALKLVVETKYANAEPFVNGIQLYIKVQYDVYQTSMVLYEAKYKVVSKGKVELVTYKDVQ